MPTVDSPPAHDASTLPHEPIRHNELIMRRFFHSSKHYKPKSSPLIQEGAFHPRPADDTGISLSRRKSEEFPHFLDESALKAACAHPDPKIRENCGVCAFRRDDMSLIDLKIDTDPLPSDLGHVLLPQINYDDFFGPNSTIEQQEFIRLLIRKIIAIADKMMLIAPVITK